MARVNIEEIVNHLSSEMRRALAMAVRSQLPDADIDELGLLREFTRAVGRECMIWEQVPDHYVEKN